MGCAPKNLMTQQDRGVWHVSMKPLTPRMKHTRVPQTGSHGYLAACYRNIVDTKPSHFFKPNSESDRKWNRKPEKAEWTEPKIKSPKKEKNSTYLASLWIITWADWCGAIFTNLKLQTLAFLQTQRCLGRNTSAFFIGKTLNKLDQNGPWLS